MHHKRHPVHVIVRVWGSPCSQFLCPFQVYLHNRFTGIQPFLLPGFPVKSHKCPHGPPDLTRFHCGCGMVNGQFHQFQQPLSNESGSLQTVRTAGQVIVIQKPLYPLMAGYRLTADMIHAMGIQKSLSVRLAAVMAEIHVIPVLHSRFHIIIVSAVPGPCQHNHKIVGHIIFIVDPDQLSPRPALFDILPFRPVPEVQDSQPLGS